MVVKDFGNLNPVLPRCYMAIHNVSVFTIGNEPLVTGAHLVGRAPGPGPLFSLVKFVKSPIFALMPIVTSKSVHI